MTATRPTTSSSRPKPRLGPALRAFPWVHLALGLLGNALFVIGSVLFFWESVKTAAIWLFVIGSTGMLLGSVGELLVRIDKRRHGED
ncbi:YrhK family protein [Mycolicibacterium aichiense]|uniref:YrhK family protein n=1 Tax=Mycolicibacterium aichiense TaxID=1799 RepID=UPI003D675E62